MDVCNEYPKSGLMCIHEPFSNVQDADRQRTKSPRTNVETILDCQDAVVPLLQRQLELAKMGAQTTDAMRLDNSKPRLLY